MSDSNKDIERCSTTAHLSKRFRWTNPSFDDLPEDVFAEILCRLACHKLLIRCKCVSKRWQSHVSFLIHDPNFISRFIRLKRDGKTPVVRTLLNSEGNEFRVTKAEELVTTMKMKAKESITAVTMEVEELLTRMSSNAEDHEALITTADFATIVTKTVERSLGVISPKPLAPLFKSLMMSRYGLEKEPVVLATYNDLVLCKYGNYNYCNYHICNPYTKQSVALPARTNSLNYRVAVGFICDVDNNCGTRCRVVRIPPAKLGYIAASSKSKVEIFSSETGLWRESTILFDQQVSWVPLINDTINIIYPYNGMLYWKTDGHTFVGFDPFMIDGSSSDGGDIMDHYKGRIIEFGDYNEKSNITCLGMCGGRLRFTGDLDYYSYELPVWELEEEEDERAHDRSGKLVLKCTRYSLDIDLCSDRDLPYPMRRQLVFDPNDENQRISCTCMV